MNASDLVAKAELAIASAKLLIDVGDVDGACNRVPTMHVRCGESGLALVGHLR